MGTEDKAEIWRDGFLRFRQFLLTNVPHPILGTEGAWETDLFLKHSQKKAAANKERHIFC